MNATIPDGFHPRHRRFTSACSIVIALAIRLAGCLPNFKYPVGRPDDAVAVPELIGAWRGNIWNYQGYSADYGLLVEISSSDAKILDVASKVFFPRVTDQALVMTWRGHVSEVDGRRYLNLLSIASGSSDRPLKPTDEPYFWILPYHLDPAGSWVLEYLSRETLARGIAASRLKGRAGFYEHGLQVGVVSSEAELAAFLAEPGGPLIKGQPLVLWRVGGPPSSGTRRK